MYSLQLANLLSFFQSDTPALPRPHSLPLYPYLSYGGLNSAATSWAYEGITTLGPYGPGLPCPDAAIGGTCPGTALAFAIYTAPLPVPPAGFSMVTTVWTRRSCMPACLPQAGSKIRYTAP